MRVRLLLTETPLARQHAHRLEHGTARPTPIPWSRFDRRAFAAESLALAHDTARSLACGEYGAVALFAHVAGALALAGVPFDLVSAAARIPSDEIRHGELACRMASACSGRPISALELDVDRDVLVERCAPIRSMEQLDMFMLELPAISETLATALLDACRERAREPVTRAFYANIVRDEVHHARLGWYYLAWRAAQWTSRERQRVADRAGELVVEVTRRFRQGRDAPAGLEEEARALGVLDTARQRAAVRAVMEQEIVPGLDALGLGASHAWARRVA